MSYKGKLVFEDLGTGAWVLQTSDGKKLQLLGDIPVHLDGSDVQVEGSAVDNFGFAMTGGGKAIEVHSISKS